MDWYSDDSDPDIDEDLREDLDALRRSCIVSGEIRARPLLTSPQLPNRAHRGRGGDCAQG